MNSRFFLLVVALAAAGSSHAQDGQIDFTGNLLAATCTVNINGSGSGDGTVTLRTVAASDLSNAGDVAGRLTWRVVVGSDADRCLAPRVQLGFRNGGNVNAAGRLNNTGSARFVDVQLVNMNDAGSPVINLADNSNSQVRDIPPGTGFVVLNYAAQYYAVGAASGGTVTTSVQYDLIYP